MLMNLLTSQLKQKLTEMESKIPEQPSGNDTCKVLVAKLEQTVKEVQQNNSHLGSDLETLQLKYNLLTEAFENRTAELKNSLQELKQLKNIQQLQSLNNLNEKFQKIDYSVSSLKSHEQARNQDFLALYNLTIQSESEMHSKMNQYRNEMSNKINELQRNINNKVSLTACVEHQTMFSSDETIKFTDIRTTINNANISSFQSTGLYVCTVSYLYLISVVLMSKTGAHEINILKNNNKIVSGWMDDYYTSSANTYWSSAAAVTTTWIKIHNKASVSNQYPSMAKYLADQSSMHHELETLRRQQEMSMNLLTSQLEQKLAEMEAKSPNNHPETTLAKSYMKMALTACVDPPKNVAAAEAIKFKDIRTNRQPNVSSFRSTGLYVCTVSDLYHISVVLMMHSENHRFHIMKNNNRLVSGWVDQSSSTDYWRSHAVVTATWLQVGDTVKVTSEKAVGIGNGIASCLTIVRIS
ncbi:unnamed protein product [Mytilus edulis]|uniref:C1q domain-containing protein n=1 Tax=Mytilus edulis TaxID=6550 RepID=A0A8S3V7E6_MYTED|nr:unnamed protein product [Mytilus edulis]